VIAFTGMRKGELAHLEWEDVDFENRLLHVRAKKDWTPKGNEERTIPLTEGAIQALQELWKRNERRKPKSSYVQPGRKGPLKDIRTGLDAACDRAGIPRVPAHGLRHTFGSQLAMAGANPFAIQKAMGHKYIKTTMIYVDVAKPHIREQVEKLDRIVVPPSPQRIKALPL
jgi:integrase